MLAAASPALKIMFERMGKPEIRQMPDVLRPGGGAAVIVCNHVGWADGFWMAYAIYPRSLRFLSKRELFTSPVSRWMMAQGGSIPIDRSDPSPTSIKSAIELLHRGEILLIFPSGTRAKENAPFKRGAATIALHAQAPIIPAYYEGPAYMHVSHLLGRPRVTVTFGAPIETAGRTVDRDTATSITLQVQDRVEALACASDTRLQAA